MSWEDRVRSKKERSSNEVNGVLSVDNVFGGIEEEGEEGGE